MKNREHIPPQELLWARAPFGERKTERFSFPDGYRPYLMLVPEDAPEVDFEAAYRTWAGSRVSVITPPVRDEGTGTWWVVVQWANGNLYTYKLNNLTKIETVPVRRVGPEPTVEEDWALVEWGIDVGPSKEKDRERVRAAINRLKGRRNR